MTDLYRKVPLNIIESAIVGDTIAILQVVDHYQGYITTLASKDVIDRKGNRYRYIDEYMRRQLETHLITKIITFKILD